MQISSATATSLGNKLAGLDLTDEEGVLLATLLDRAAAADGEVQGFGKTSQPGPDGYTEVEWKYAKIVSGPLPSQWKVEEGEPAASLHFDKIEW